MLERLLINDWNKYIDFTSGGIFSGILGQNGLVDAMMNVDIDAIPSCCYSAHYRDPTTERYIAMLKEFTGYESVALFSTGSEATEAFWRCMRVYTGKPGIWGGLPNPDDIGKDKPEPACDSMHGMTLGSMVMAGKMTLPHPQAFKPLGADLHSQDAAMTCGMIMEPYHAPSAQFYPMEPIIRRIKDRQKIYPDIPLCMDEVQGGFGRTGKLFAYQWYSDTSPTTGDEVPILRPDFVCIGKAMGGGLPLSALLGPKEIMESETVVRNAHLHSTHSGNPLMCAAGIAVIKAIQEQDLITESYRKGLILADLLKDCGVRYHAGRGLLAGLEFNGPLEADKVVQRCREKGLLTVSTGRKWVKLGPPYVIIDEDLEAGIKILKEAIEVVKK